MPSKIIPINKDYLSFQRKHPTAELSTITNTNTNTNTSTNVGKFRININSSICCLIPGCFSASPQSPPFSPHPRPFKWLRRQLHQQLRRASLRRRCLLCRSSRLASRAMCRRSQASRLASRAISPPCQASHLASRAMCLRYQASRLASRAMCRRSQASRLASRAISPPFLTSRARLHRRCPRRHATRTTIVTAVTFAQGIAGTLRLNADFFFVAQCAWMPGGRDSSKKARKAMGLSLIRIPACTPSSA